MITIVACKNVKTVGQKYSYENNQKIFEHFIKEYNDDRGIIDLLINNPFKNGVKGCFPGFIFAKFNNASCPRAKEHISELNLDWITFDIDNKNPDDIFDINDFYNKFKEYEYFIYTTSSHLKDGKTPAFRAFLKCKNVKFDHNIEEEYSSYLELMEKEFNFGGIDRSCFQINRIFYCPNITNESKQNYYSYHNEGKEYEISVSEYNNILRTKKIMKSLQYLKKKPVIKNDKEYDALSHAQNIWDKYHSSNWVEGSKYQQAIAFIGYCAKKGIDWYIIKDILSFTGDIKNNEWKNYENYYRKKYNSN